MTSAPGRLGRGLLVLGLMVSLASCADTGSTTPGPTGPRAVTPRLHADQPPLIFGHRGAAGYRPEETLESFETGVRMGANYIELDLVSTKDHVLVARHENEISATTNVADHPEFAERKTSKTIDGTGETGWFTEDFTLAELRTLRAKERIPGVRPGNTDYDGRFEVPTFAEVLALRARLTTELGRPVGIAPETKHPTYFASIGLPIEPPMVAALHTARLDTATAPVVIQSFELGNLLTLRASGFAGRTLFLLDAKGAPASTVDGGPKDFAGFTTPEGLAFLKGKVDAIGPEKGLVIARTWEEALDQPSTLVQDAHADGLLVIPYTFRVENQFLPSDYWVGTNPNSPGKGLEEQEAYLAAGVDGLFTDQPDVTVRARDAALGR